MEEEYNVSLLQEKVNALDIIKSESTILPKSKIRVAMLQIEDRDDPFFNWCMNLNRQYCEKHDIDYIYFHSGPSYIPPYWWKVLVFLDLLNLKKHDIVCWMDSDAFVYNTKVDIREFFNESSRSMVVAPDPDGWGSKFMAAVYMAKNNVKSREILDIQKVFELTAVFVEIFQSFTSENQIETTIVEGPGTGPSRETHLEYEFPRNRSGN